MAGTTMINLKGLLKSIGILPDEEISEQRERHRVKELERTDRRQEDKLNFADKQLDKVRDNQISEQEFWNLLDMWPGENEGENEPH